MDTGGVHRVMEIYNPGSEIKHVEQPVLACFRKLSSPVDDNKTTERQNGKRSLNRKLETPLTPQNSLQLVRNSWPEITTINVIFFPQNDPETVA